MGLIAWDQGLDGFSHVQLQANWNAVDKHDHTPGNGVQLGTSSISPLAITTALLASNAVTNAQLAANAVGTANIQDASVTASKLAPGAASAAISNGAITSAMLDPNILPLGSVLMWYRGPNSSVTPAGGWEIMDGRPWSSIVNSLGLTQGNIPDMRGVFARGADINGTVAPGIGSTGGSNTVNLSHSHNVNNHSHSLATHTHSIGTDGSHFHTFMGGWHLNTRQNAFQVGLTVNDHSGVQRQNTLYATYINAPFGDIRWGFNWAPSQTNGQTDMDSAGDHNHGGSTGTGGPNFTAYATATTDSQLGSTSILPQNTSLLYIMRCR